VTADQSSSILVGCRCGSVRGRLADATPGSVNHVICYCDDCQAFAHWLHRGDLLDARGGSDIVQVAPGSVSFDAGHDRIAGVRLTPKGLYRWYARCCHTPLGNTVSPAIPFVGIVTEALDIDGQSADRQFGPPVGAIKGEYALGEPPPGSKGIQLSLMLRAIVNVLGWRLKGRVWPHPFFSRSGETLYSVTVLSHAEREALRPLCGPRPSVVQQ
jgi:hypothetical protein